MKITIDYWIEFKSNFKKIYVFLKALRKKDGQTNVEMNNIEWLMSGCTFHIKEAECYYKSEQKFDIIGGKI